MTVSQMVKLDSFKDTMKTVRSLNAGLTDAHQGLCSVAEIACKEQQDFVGIHFEKLLNEHGKNDLIPVYLENNTFNFNLNQEVKSAETHNVSDAEQCFAKKSQQSGNEYGRAARSVSPVTTLNRDGAPMGDDIEPMEESRADVETGKEESLEAEIPTVEMNPQNPMSRAEQEHEDCGHAVYRNWCAACVEACGVGRQLQAEPLEEEERKNDGGS